MASIVSHIIYAKKYFEKLETGEIKNGRVENLDKDEFILGCVFPDIRSIAEEITRQDSHLHFNPIDLNFKNLTSFEAGWKFHLYCDMKRDEILNKYNFYNLKNTTDFYSGSAKLLEDELVYNEYANWEKLILYFNHPPYIKTDLDIDKNTFQLWYAMAAKYMERKPDNKSMRVFLSKLPKRAKKARNIVESVSELRENKKACELLLQVKEEIV